MSPASIATAAAPVVVPTPVAVAADTVSLRGVAALDAGVLSRIVRTHGLMARSGRKIRIVNATPDVERALRDLGLGWMLPDVLRGMEPANEPMRPNAA
jgi:anti-anti-sigma regulatory factor